MQNPHRLSPTVSNSHMTGRRWWRRFLRHQCMDSQLPSQFPPVSWTYKSAKSCDPLLQPWLTFVVRSQSTSCCSKTETSVPVTIALMHSTFAAVENAQQLPQALDLSRESRLQRVANRRQEVDSCFCIDCSWRWVHRQDFCLKQQLRLRSQHTVITIMSLDLVTIITPLNYRSPIYDRVYHTKSTSMKISAIMNLE